MRYKTTHYFYKSMLVIIGLCVMIFPAPNPSNGAGSDNHMTSWRTSRTSGTLPGRPRTGSFERTGITVMLNLVKVQYAVAGKAWIYNFDTKRFWVINNAAKEYAEGSFKDLAKYHKKILAGERKRLKGIKGEMSSMSEEAQKQRIMEVDQQLDLLNPKTAVKAKPIKESPINVAGFDASPVGVYMGDNGDNMVEKLWVTDDFDMPSSWKKFLKMMSELDPARWKAEYAVDEVPVKGETHFGGVTNTWEIQTLAPGPISIDEFRIPINFDMVELSEIK